MYIDTIDRFMTVKCKHPECFGKTYPCNHSVILTKNEMVVANNGNVNIYINHLDDDLVEFQQIDIYEDDKLNELVFKSLSGKSLPLADIIFYYYENNYIYGEDENCMFIQIIDGKT